MGNSSTSRYADGRDLYHADAALNRWLRTLVVPRAPGERFIIQARRQRTASWPRTRASLSGAPAPSTMSLRRAEGELARVLMDPDAGPRIRRLARRHRLDEGDVAALWVSATATVPAPNVLASAPEAEPA